MLLYHYSPGFTMNLLTLTVLPVIISSNVNGQNWNSIPKWADFGFYGGPRLQAGVPPGQLPDHQHRKVHWQWPGEDCKSRKVPIYLFYRQYFSTKCLYRFS